MWLRSTGLLVVFTLLAQASFVYAAPRPSTPADKAAIEATGLVYKTGMLWDPGDAFVGDEVAVATKFLIEHMGNGSRGTQCYSAQTDRITKLNPAFKVGLYKALSEIERQFGGKNIIQSGYRCDGTNGNHPRGCAVDIIWASCKAKGGDGWRCSSDRFDAPEQKWIDANGKNAPYNIHLRLRYAPEGHHVEPVNTQGCVTGAQVGSGSPSGSPSSDFSNAIRQALGVSQQPQLAPQPALPPQPIAPQQSPIGAFQEPVSQGLATPSEPGTASSSSSIADRLAELAGIEPRATTTTSATSVPIVIDGSDRGGIASTRGESGSTTTSAGGAGITQNTFITDDLAFQAEPVDGTQNAFAQILASIKATLLRMLQYLRPFGGAQHYLEMEDEY
ncbi:MAG: hypothetical protein AAB734_03535 [Patescibacteria group bacterium]